MLRDWYNDFTSSAVFSKLFSLAIYASFVSVASAFPSWINWLNPSFVLANDLWSAISAATRSYLPNLIRGVK